MATGKVVVADEVGLHARPAAKFVQLAKRFGSDIRLSNGERSADAKSMLAVLTLEVGQGDEVELEADGDDAEEAVRALIELLEHEA
jgi:phosphocarrier protein HPr